MDNNPENPITPTIPADQDEKMVEAGAGIEGPPPKRPLLGVKSGPRTDNTTRVFAPDIRASGKTPLKTVLITPAKK